MAVATAGQAGPHLLHQDAVNAVECALEMGETLEELNEEWQRRGEPTARMRVGILTGPAVVGAIGSAERKRASSCAGSEEGFSELLIATRL